MPSLICPMCGKHTPLGSFQTPDNDDIEFVTVRGLGRGKGFEVSERGSVFGDDEYEDAITAISRRTQEIIGLLEREGYLPADHSKDENEVE